MECILFCILLRLIISPKYFKNFSASDALCLAIAVFGVAMQCSKRYFKVHFGGPVFIIAQVEFSRFVAKTCFALILDPSFQSMIDLLLCP